MVLTDEELRRTEDAILAILSRSPLPYAPAKLMDDLAKEGISEFSVRAAIWYMTDRNDIELTSDRKLKPANHR